MPRWSVERVVSRRVLLWPSPHGHSVDARNLIGSNGLRHQLHASARALKSPHVRGESSTVAAGADPRRPN
jgi:hypothetical protein